MFVKVTAGNETRKLQVEEGITFEELKQRVASTFPALSDGKVEFDLRYQDTDGDLIHVSSDAEVATAISHLPADSVWRLLVVPKSTAAGQESSRRQPRRLSSMMPVGPSGIFGGFGPRFDSMWDNLLGEMSSDPFWSPVGLFSWGDRERRTREWENYMQQREQQFEQEMQQVRQMQEDHLRQFEEQRKKAEESITKTLNAPPGSEPAAQQQQQQSVARQQNSSGAGAQGGSGQPKWHCQTFGSWEPTNYESPYGRRTVIGPVGYHMYWGYSDPEPMDTEQEKKKEEGDSEEEKPAEDKA